MLTVSRRPITPRGRPGSASAAAAAAKKSVLLGATGNFVRVFPAAVEIRDAELTVMHVLSITVLNIDKKSRRISFKPPQKREFALHYVPSAPVAPGMEVSVELAFRTDENRDFHDQIIVECETDRIAIPLHAYVPKASVEFETFCNFGSLAPDHAAVHFTELVNVGKRPCDWRFIQEDGSVFKIVPSYGSLGAAESNENTARIKVELKGLPPGQYRSVAQLEVNSILTGQVLDINALVIRQTLDVLWPDGGGIVEKMNFGTLYYGQSTQQKVILMNDGPEATTYSFSIVPINGNSEYAADKEPFIVTPKEGMLQPFEQVPVIVEFGPMRPQYKTGFKCKAKAPLDERHDLNYVLVAERPNTEQKCKVVLGGKAVRHAVSISHHELRFGECMTNENLDILVTLKNDHEELAVTFSIERIVHFKARPTSGRLLPLQSMNLVVSFCPSQMGHHKNTLKIIICDGLDVIPLSVFGVCGGEGPHKKLTGGPTKNVEDFKPNFVFVEPDAYITSTVAKEPFVRRAAWDKYPPHLVDGVSDVTWSAEELAKRQQHKRAYDKMIREPKGAAEEEALMDKGDLTEIVHKQGFAVFASGADMGMEPYSGLNPPEPPLPKAKDTLWLAKEAKKDPSTTDAVQPRVMHLDEDRLFTHKFKTRPTQAREVKECKMALNPSELLRISTHPRSMDFGKVCVQSTAGKCFAVCNDTQKHILVAIAVDASELQRSTPSSQVIPPGATAGFDIIVYSETSQSIATSVSYTINNIHSFKFDVCGEVVPVMLKLSRTQINFRFPSHVYDPYMVEVVTITNPGNNRADFQWVNGSTFTALPAKGSVEPMGSEDIKITYMPSSATRNEEQLRLTVVGGEDCVVTCVGEVEEGKIQAKVRSLEIGVVAAGSVQRRSISLKNVGNNDAVFSVDVFAGGPIVSPAKGSIPTSGQLDLQLTFRPSMEGHVEGNITVIVRGGKNIRIPFSADVAVPDIVVETDEIDFGSVYLGTSHSRAFVVNNRSLLSACLVMDLRGHPEFSVNIPRQFVDDEDDEGDDDLSNPMLPTPRGNALNSQTFDGRSVYRFTIPPEKKGCVDVVYVPTMLEDHAFELPLAIKGLPPHAKHRRVIVAQAIKPRIIVSTPSMDFKDKVVVNEKAKKFSYTMELVLTNCSDSRVFWDLALKNDQQGEAFGIDTRLGELESGAATSVQVSFCPKFAADFGGRLLLYLDRNVDGEAYFVVELKGRGMMPSLAFDRREVILPVVPLGVAAQATLFVINQGYDNLEVTYKLPTEASRVPLEVVLPEGNMIGLAKQKLPVVIRFLSKRSVSFTARIDFLDAEGNCYSVMVMGSTDNCIFSNHPFVMSSIGDIIAEDPSKPPMFLLRDDRRDYVGLASDNSPLFQELQLLTKPKALATLLRWANLILFRTPVSSIPGDLRSSKGRALLEALEAITGKAPPKNVSKGKTENLNRREQALNDYQNLLLLCDFLKSYGALINHVKPEFLLPYDDFCRLAYASNYPLSSAPSSLGVDGQEGMGNISANNNNNNAPSGTNANNAAAPGAAAPASSVNIDTSSMEILPEHRAFFDQNFETLSAAAWTSLIYQTIRIFILSRINAKSIRFVAGIDRAGGMPIGESSCTGSNLYSTSECLLMQWITYHHNKIHTSDNFRFANFATGFRDGRTLAALIMSHVPTIRSLQLVKKIDTSLSQHDQQRQATANIQIVCDAMEELRMEYIPEPEDILTGSFVEMLLLAMYLHQTLPQYVPKTVIQFEGRLSDTVTKLIELNNPSSKSITYSVRLDGSPDFHIQADEVKLEPKSKVHFAIDFVSRFTRPMEATLFFNSRKGVGGTHGVTLVFTLRATVDSYKISESVNLEAKLYEQVTVNVPVSNPFPSDCEFQISLQEEPYDASDNSSNVGAMPGGVKKPNKKKHGGQGSVTSHAAIPKEAFWCKKSSLRVNAGESVALPMQFLPFRLSKHRCLVMFKEPELGEFVVELLGEVLLPPPVDAIKFSSENKSVITKDIVLAPKNSNIERTRNTLVERLGGQMSKDVLKALTESGPMTYRVEYTAPFFSGPSEVVINSNKGQPGVNAAAAAKGNSNNAGANNARSSQLENKLMVELHPKGPGTYHTRIILRSAIDCRVIEVECLVSAMGLRAALDFTCPARQSITQDIPVINVSQKDWHIHCHLDGLYFTGGKELRVPAGGRANYSLTFRPDWVCTVDGELSMINSVTNDKYVYTLKGVGEEPVAEDHVVINCRARWRNEAVFRVPNTSPLDVVYNVESDLPGISGPPQLSVGSNREAEYLMTINMPRGGHYHGTLTFNAPDGKFVWYTIEVHAENPPEEKTVEVVAKTRTAVAVDITIMNPMNRSIEFEVILNGEGLLGNKTLSLEPFQTTTYELIFSPLLPGHWVGSLTFVNDDVGEFWYKLVLTATPADPVVLPNMTAEVGKTTSQIMTLDNYTDNPILLKPIVSNNRNFSVNCPSQGVSIEPWGTADVPLVYQPSSLTEIEETTITFRDQTAGDWMFVAKGRGVPPSDMDTILVTAAIGSSSSNIIDFRNPFAFPISLIPSLNTKEVEIFQMLTKSKEVTVGPFKDQQFAFLFQPKKMADHSCVISLDCPALKISWKYPITGVAEAPPSGGIGKLLCKARESVRKTVEVELVGTTTSTNEGVIDFEITTAAGDSMRRQVLQSLSVSMNNNPPLPPPTFVRFDLVYEPMRPMRAKAELCVTRPSGGRWRFTIDLVATDPEIDDVITIEGALKKTSSVSFRMTNQFQAPAAFTARFTPESPTELTVQPSSGVLPAFGEEGSNFVVSFTPSEYGKNYTGKLVIETEDMQWTYEVRGVPPQYVAPKAAASKVQSRIDPEVESNMARKERNFMKENTKALKQSRPK